MKNKRESGSNEIQLKFREARRRKLQGIQGLDQISEDNPKHGGNGGVCYTNSGVKTAPPCGGSHPARKWDD